MSVLEAVSLASLLAWLLLRLDRWRRWPEEQRQASPIPGSVDDVASVVAIVPARNEAALLARTLPALLQQRDVRLQVLLVDDDSSDGTSAVARRLARDCGAEGRLHVLEIESVSPGWSGKVYALHEGLRALETLQSKSGVEPVEWLLFTDADIRHRPGAVADLLRRAEDRSTDGPWDLVSVMARLHAETFWERLLVPPFVFFFQVLYPFRRVAQRESRVAAAAGGCILIRRSLLRRAGGLEAIRGAVIDDVSLARSIKEAGGRVWLGFDSGIRSLRSYRCLSDFWEMVARTAFAQLGYRWSLLGLTLAALCVLVASPPAVMGLGLWHLAESSKETWSIARALVWAAMTWVLQGLALQPVVRWQGVPGRFAAGLPVAGLLYALMTASSAWRHAIGRGGRWRDRPVRPTAG